MVRALRVKRTVKARIRLVQPGFQHLEHFRVPVSYLISVDVFNRCAPEFGNLADFLSTQAMDALAEQVADILAVDFADQLRTPNIPHRLKDISLNSGLGNA